MELTPAFVLHQRPYQESSLLIDIVTAQYGRRKLVARGVRKTKRHGSNPLQLFQPLWLNWFGHGELQTLQKVETNEAAFRLTGHAALCGLYVNELLFHFLHLHDAEPTLFTLYQQLLAELESNLQPEISLRIFEMQLLDTLGYGLNLHEDSAGQAILPEAFYRYLPEQGLVLSVSRPDAQLIAGKSVLQFVTGAEMDVTSLKQIKRLMRSVINYHLDGKPLKSRQLFVEMQRYARIEKD